MRKVRLKIFGLGMGNYLQADVKLYDSNCRLIYDGKTYDGEISIYLEENTCYKLCAYSCGRYINVWFYVSCNHSYYIFSFNEVENNVTFLLTDYYYDNLPIEKGELMLWQK